jgi:hypothetical protein
MLATLIIQKTTITQKIHRKKSPENSPNLVTLSGQREKVFHGENKVVCSLFLDHM